MRTLRNVVTVLGLSTLGLCADQDILTILQQQDNLSTFTAFVQQNQDIVDILNNGTFTRMISYKSDRNRADKRSVGS